MGGRADPYDPILYYLTEYQGRWFSKDLKCIFYLFMSLFIDLYLLAKILHVQIHIHPKPLFGIPDLR